MGVKYFSFLENFNFDSYACEFTNRSDLYPLNQCKCVHVTSEFSKVNVLSHLIQNQNSCFGAVQNKW